MSNTDFLRQSEADLLPPGFVHGHSFELCIGEYRGYAEVDGWHPARREAVEICQSETGGAPKAGQRRKMASDALKLIFLKSQGCIDHARMYVTSPEMYTWFHQAGSWLSSACRYYEIHVELKRHDKKHIRKRVRNVMRRARSESHL